MRAAWPCMLLRCSNKRAGSYEQSTVLAGDKGWWSSAGRGCTAQALAAESAQRRGLNAACAELWLDSQVRIWCAGWPNCPGAAGRWRLGQKSVAAPVKVGSQALIGLVFAVVGQCKACKREFRVQTWHCSRVGPMERAFALQKLAHAPSQYRDTDAMAASVWIGNLRDTRSLESDLSAICSL